MAAALAVGLADDLGVRRGDRVVVQLQNIPGFLLLAMLALWRLGAVMVPVNLMYKQRELEVLLRDSGAKALVQMESLYPDAGRPAAQAVGGLPVVTTSELDLVQSPPERLFAGITRQRHDGTLDLLELVRKHEGQRSPPVELGPDDLALLVYTSGTTGPPKGAMNTHGNVVYNSEVYRVWVGLTPDDVCLAVAPLFHVTGLVAHLGVALLLPMPLVLG